MKARLSGLLAVPAALLVFGCLSDPVSDLDGNAAAVVASEDQLQLSQGDTVIVTASVLDGRGVALATPVTFTACDADVTVGADTSYHPVPATSARAIVGAAGPGASCVVAAGGGFADTVPATVLPVNFAGAASTLSPLVGQPLTLNSTPVLQFNPATADINFGGGVRGIISSRTATALTVIVPVTGAAQPAALTVDGIDVTYVPGLNVSLPTSGVFNITNPFDPNDAPDPAATVAIPGTTYEGFASGAADNFYTITLAAATTFTVTLSWPGGADLDILFCNAGCSASVGNFNGATSANPEVSQVTLGPGSFNLWINNFTPATAAPIYQVDITTP